MVNSDEDDDDPFDSVVTLIAYRRVPGSRWSDSFENEEHIPGEVLAD